MEIVLPSKKSLFQQKFQKKLYHFNRNFQFRSVMQKMIQLDIRSRSQTKKSNSDSQCCYESDSDSTQKPPTPHDLDSDSGSATLPPRIVKAS